MKPTTKNATRKISGILVCLLAGGLAWAQRPEIIQNVRTTMNAVQTNNANASNEALGITRQAPPARNASPAASKPSAVGVRGPAQPRPAVAPKPGSMPPAKSSGPKASAGTAKPAGPPPRARVVQARPMPVVAVSTASPATPGPAATQASSSGEPQDAKNIEENAQDKKWSMTGKRDPFISPVVNRAGGSGCSTGKKCLEIGAINLRGVVHSEAGFIAVVTNSLNKAYFLRENDPVFDGYVVKITGDSIVFQETVQDRLGKTFTREVVKKITTPAV